MKPGVTEAAAQAEMDALAARLDERKRGEGIGLDFAARGGGRSDQTGVLKLCANLANLTLAQALGRRKEMGIQWLSAPVGGGWFDRC